MVVWLGKKPVEPVLQKRAETNAMQSSVVADTDKASNLQVGSSAVQTNPAIGGVAPSPAPTMSIKSKGEEMKEELAAFNDEDIVLYGRVIDQFGAPIADATVTGSIQVNNGARVGTDRVSLTTDANGTFTVSGYKGKTLGIWVAKNGYVMATTGTSFVYSHLWSEAERYNPNPANPAIIKMWKLQGAERLTGINQRYKFRFSDNTLYFDVLAGKIVSSGGDLRIKMTRSMGEVSERTLQDWGVQIEAVDGGLIKTSVSEARVTYRLPEEGYEASDLFIMSTNPPHKWVGAADQMYFVKSRDGQIFSKLNFSLSINQQPNDYVWVELHGELNSYGSRNFEADANAMAIKQK